MAVQPFYNPKFRAFDSNGDPLAGGLLYTYAAGTTTPLATYTTRAGSIANANPVVLDANGEADVWTSPGVDYKFVLKNSAGVTQWTVDNVPSPSTTDTDSSADVATSPGGRLSLTSGNPVTTSNVTGGTTIYYVPFRSDRIPLFNGTSWSAEAIATELSQSTADNTKSPAPVANNSCYDLFIWDDSGTLRLSRGPAWPSDTSRGSGAGSSELERVNGRNVNKVSISNGPEALRGFYVGTVRSDGSAQINDTVEKRHVWNAHNRVMRPMVRVEPEDNWGYVGAARQANGNAANQIDFVIGLLEEPVSARLVAAASVGEFPGNVVAFLGLDSTSIGAPSSLRALTGVDTAFISTPLYIPLFASYVGHPGIGRHYIAWLEYSDAGLTYWYGDNGGVMQSGIHGEVWG